MTILDSVKNALGITGDGQDATLAVYIDEVQKFMVSAGVPTETANSVESAGVIARGVIDLWTYNNGDAEFSPYFINRVVQLRYNAQNGG